MAKEIKQKIVLEGEKQYNQAIKEAQRNLRTLKSELKAETAEMGRNATEQQKAEAKAKSLKAQIAEQEKVVRTLRAALAEAKASYGDNADEVAKWEQKLNNARTTLANMQNDLEGVSGGFKTVNTDAAQATVATKSVADAIGSLGSAGDGVATAIEDIFTGVIDVVTEAVGELWDLISQTASTANNWTDIAGYWGTDAQTIQQYARAVGASADSFDDLQSAVSRIVMGGKGKTISELIGVSDVNYQNDWDYAMAVMDQLSEMSASGKDMTNIYEAIFGEKKGTKVMDLINDWQQIRESLPEFNGNESGYGMSDQELSTMNDLWVKINEIETKWTALKENFAAGFGVATLDLLVNVEGALDGIADYMNATDDAGREAALQKIRTNVEEFFTKLGDIIRECIGILREVGTELQASDDPLTRAIGDILVSLTEALQWMVDNADKVKAAFETIFGVWLIAKLAAVAGKLSSILLQIKTIQTFNGLGGAASGAAGGAASGAAGGTAAGGAGLGSVAATVGPWAAVAAISGAMWFGLGENAWHRDWDEFNANEAKMTEDTPKILRELHDAVTGEDEGAMTQSLFRRYANDFLRLSPESEVFGKAGNVWDLSDGLSEQEIEEILAGGFEQAGIFGEDWTDLMKEIYNKLNEEADGRDPAELPEDWWRTTGSWSGTPGENGVTSKDLENLGTLPGNVESASERGVARGIRGLRVEIDGQAAGRILAPYVSREIARDVVEY